MLPLRYVYRQLILLFRDFLPLAVRDYAPLLRPSPYSVYHLLRPFVQRKSDLRINVIDHLHTWRQATLAVDTKPVIGEPGMARRLAAKSIYCALGL